MEDQPGFMGKYSAGPHGEVESCDELERLKSWVNDLQSGMYVNCVYCGHRYGHKDEVPVSMADVLKEHIEKCPEHPMSKLRARIDGAQKGWGVTGDDGKFDYVVTGEHSGFEIEKDVPVLILRDCSFERQWDKWSRIILRDLEEDTFWGEE